MFAMEPQRTDYDVNFDCLGFSVRVHPFFWLAGLILGASGAWTDAGEVTPDAGVQLLSWISVMFASILVHELGHSLVMRYFGQSSHIVLYMLGGLAIPDSSYSSFSKPARQTRLSHILISLAGPGAGFLLAILTVALIYALGGQMFLHTEAFPFYQFYLPPDTSRPLVIVVNDLLWMNIFWGLMNLLPVFPLDGGQVARQLLEQADQWNGFARCLQLSMVTCIAVAIASWVYIDSRFMPLMFISLAASNYMVYQQLTGGGSGGGRW